MRQAATQATVPLYLLTIAAAVLLSQDDATASFILVACGGSSITMLTAWLARRSADDDVRSPAWWALNVATSAATAVACASVGASPISVVVIGLAAGTFLAAITERTPVWRWSQRAGAQSAGDGEGRDPAHP